MNSIQVKNLSGYQSAAKRLLDENPGKKIFAFYGEMGAGKTTFIKEICKQLGVNDNTSSPTFSIINEYIGNGGQKIYHFDFYRIKNIEEAYDMGYEDYLYSNAFCFIEWPEKIKELLPENTVSVTIAILDGNRSISVV